MASIYGEPAVIRRIEQRSAVHKVTSNGTIACCGHGVRCHRGGHHG
jgi:hypothetical protein